jgi:hypothetical protein
MQLAIRSDIVPLYMLLLRRSVYLTACQYIALAQQLYTVLVCLYLRTIVVPARAHVILHYECASVSGSSVCKFAHMALKCLLHDVHLVCCCVQVFAAERS